MTPSSPYIGLDVGTRRIGVATCDPAGSIAMPHATVAAGRGEQPAGRIGELVADTGCHTLVVGWPLTLEGREGRAVRRVQAFLDILGHELGRRDLSVDIVSWDERLTTTAAETFLIEADVSRRRRRDVVDQVAAHHILQSYLDSLDEPTTPTTDNRGRR